MSFPEEPLDLPSAEGGGYYPALIGQKLNGDQYEVVRKLGYGPRSSVWLVLCSRLSGYFAVKIYTVAASDRANRVELPILRSLKRIDRSMRLPPFQGSFWQKSEHGSHLCIVMVPLSTSIQDLQQAENGRPPVHAVQRIVCTVADSLKVLHRVDIVHGGMLLTLSQ
jgi:serine/threonine-protein kinase SRPK3